METIIKSLNSLGYIIDYRILNSKDFGVPQNRERVFIWGINLPKLIGSVADGQKENEGLLLRTMENYLLNLLLENLEELKKLQGRKLKGWILDWLTYKGMESFGLFKKSDSLKYLARMKLLPNWQSDLKEANLLSTIKCSSSISSLTEKLRESKTDIDKSEQKMGGDLNILSLWKSILEEGWSSQKESITSTLINLITGLRTYTYAEIGHIIFLFIGLERKYFSNFTERVLSALIKIKENMYGKIETAREKNSFNVIASSMVSRTEVPQNFIFGVRGESPPQVFPLGESIPKDNEIKYDTEDSIPEIGEAHRIYREKGVSPPMKNHPFLVQSLQADDYLRKGSSWGTNNPQSRRNFASRDTRKHTTLNEDNSQGVTMLHNIYGGFKEGIREFSKHSPTIRTPEGGGHLPIVVERTPLKFLQRNQKNINGNYSFTVDKTNTGGVKEGSRIRRLTPIECERLQSFPDNWTEGVSDTQRYRQMGNAVTVNVIQAIGEKILAGRRQH